MPRGDRVKMFGIWWEEDEVFAWKDAYFPMLDLLWWQRIVAAWLVLIGKAEPHIDN
jgi:hypothetical protein